MTPTRIHALDANGTSHRVLEWSSPAAPTTRTALLVHGYMDCAASFDRVAPGLADAGFRVLAPDMRGFGEGARNGQEVSYHFPEYVADLTGLANALIPSGPFSLIGHSMGGTIATYFVGAGTAPATRVDKLVLLEGLGPPDSDVETAPDRMKGWIESAQEMRSKTARPFSRDEGLRRLRLNHPNVPEEVLRSRLMHLIVATPGDDAWTWRFDARHRLPSPTPFLAAGYRAFAARVRCPVLAVSGGPLGFHPPDEATRLAAFADLTQTEIPDAGHMMHWTKPAELLACLARFL